MANPNTSKHPVRAPEPPREDPRDEPLSPRALAMLEAGLESAKRGEIRHLGDFTKYLDESDDGE
jgi:hypothetical protein